MVAMQLIRALCLASSAGLADALVSPASKNISKSTLAAREAGPQQLGLMMAQSQQSLAQAEAYYAQAVKKGKDGLAELLTTEAKILGAIIATYGETLTEVAEGLEQAANNTRAEMAAIPQPEGLDFAAEGARARLGAHVDAAEAESRRLGRKRTSALRDAAAKAMQTLEGSAQQLSRKLGDVSAVLDEAKAIVESSETQESSNAPALKNASAGKKLSIGEHASLGELQKLLVAARKTTLAQDEAADQHFAAALAQASASLSAGIAKIKAALVQAQHEEIQRVHERKVDAVPAHHRRHHRKRAAHVQ